MEEGNVEMSKLQEKLEYLETALEERDRELEIAKEKVQTLTDDLVASQGTVSSELVPLSCSTSTGGTYIEGLGPR